MCQSMLMGGAAVETHHHDWFEIFTGIFHINTMSVAPLEISSFGTFFMLSFNTVFPVKSLIAIILGYLFIYLFIFFF